MTKVNVKVLALFSTTDDGNHLNPQVGAIILMTETRAREFAARGLVEIIKPRTPRKKQELSNG